MQRKYGGNESNVSQSRLEGGSDASDFKPSDKQSHAYYLHEAKKRCDKDDNSQDGESSDAPKGDLRKFTAVIGIQSNASPAIDVFIDKEQKRTDGNEMLLKLTLCQPK